MDPRSEGEPAIILPGSFVAALAGCKPRSVRHEAGMPVNNTAQKRIQTLFLRVSPQTSDIDKRQREIPIRFQIKAIKNCTKQKNQEYKKVENSPALGSLLFTWADEVQNKLARPPGWGVGPSLHI